MITDLRFRPPSRILGYRIVKKCFANEVEVIMAAFLIGELDHCLQEMDNQLFIAPKRRGWHLSKT